MKSAKLVQDQIKVMNLIGKRHLLTSGRDISNPGTIGTLGMLLEASGTGGEIELEKIPRNDAVDWEEWLKLYPGAGFVVTSPADNVLECIDLFEKVNITCSDVGSVTSEKKLYITHNSERELIFDFQKDTIMGVREDISRGK
jgi:selenophosphate synthetase-related protein